MYDDNNVFARILRGELPSHRLYEDETCVVILDIFPINPGHALVIPKAKAALLQDLPDATAGHLLRVGSRVAKALRAADGQGGLRCEDVLFLVSDGPQAGQEVPHAHLHVVPRFQGDGFGFKLGAGNRQAQPQPALAGWAATLKGNL